MPLLREVIVRLLSEAPEARGTAAQVAQALEAGAGEEEQPAPSKFPVRARVWKPWLALAAAGACAVLLCYGPTRKAGVRAASRCLSMEAAGSKRSGQWRFLQDPRHSSLSGSKKRRLRREQPRQR